jgi:hypothetical protein
MKSDDLVKMLVRKSKLKGKEVLSSIRKAALFDYSEKADDIDWEATNIFEDIALESKTVNLDTINFPFKIMTFHTTDNTDEYSIQDYVLIEEIKSKEDDKLRFRFKVFSVEDHKLDSIVLGFFHADVSNNVISNGVIENVGELNRNWRTGKWELLDDESDPRNVGVREILIQRNITYVLRYLALLNYRDMFIVETEHFTKPGKKRIKGRSTYHVSTPRLIKKKIYNGTSVNKNGDGTPLKVGQERRGHWRTFRSDYFVNKQGETKWIKAYWAGPTSFNDPKDPNKHYIVRLDL